MLSVLPTSPQGASFLCGRNSIITLAKVLVPSEMEGPSPDTLGMGPLVPSSCLAFACGGMHEHASAGRVFVQLLRASVVVHVPVANAKLRKLSCVVGEMGLHLQRSQQSQSVIKKQSKPVAQAHLRDCQARWHRNK